MTSFRKTISLCGVCFILTALVAILSQIAPGRGEPASAVEEAWAPLGLPLRAWAGIALVVTSVVLAVWLSVTLRRRLRRDLMHLRSAIRQLATPEKAVQHRAFAVEEVSECAAELADVAERLRTEQAQLCDDAARDPLTGVANRRPFVDTLTREAAFAERTGWPLSLVMLDLDHFKALNDTYGHKAGDLALCRTADRLSSLVRQSDIVARVGGEEFAIVLPGTPLDQAIRVAQQLRNALRCDQHVFEGHTIQVTASFGVAELHDCRAGDAESLIGRADEALYEAKRGGRDTVRAAPAAQAQASAGQTAEEPPRPPGAVADSLEPSADAPIDRDALALMGSTFSVLQVIPDRHRVAHDIIQQVAATLQSQTACLFVFGEGDGRLIPIASVGLSDDDAGSVSGDLREWAEGLRSSSHFAAMRCLDPVHLQDLCQKESATAVRVPLVAYGEVVGVIEARHLPPDLRFGKRQQTVLSALSAIGATALKNCDVYERAMHRMCGLVEVLAQAIHANDVFKRDHCKWVSRITVELAEAMGQHDPEELHLLRIAGLVHDIGDICVPHHLFEKKGPLLRDEQKLVQEHSRTGAALIESVAEMQRLADIVGYHHERYDGCGYPEGLAGEFIPIESRVLAVADAYVAMTSPRPYRAALSHTEAVEQIRLAAGEQFDPAVVDVFLNWTERPECAEVLSARNMPAPGPSPPDEERAITTSG